MKNLLTILFAITISVTAFGQVQSNSNNMKINNAKIDTAIVIQKADSLAASILKTYDENSMRQTGVPLAIEHYDKTISFNVDQNNVLVSYSFNKIKFYGSSGAGIMVKEIDKYPYHFDIIHDSKTNKTSQGKMAENK
jgi:hypothetical protein